MFYLCRHIGLHIHKFVSLIIHDPHISVFILQGFNTFGLKGQMFTTVHDKCRYFNISQSENVFFLAMSTYLLYVLLWDIWDNTVVRKIMFMHFIVCSTSTHLYYIFLFDCNSSNVQQFFNNNDSKFYYSACFLRNWQKIIIPD